MTGWYPCFILAVIALRIASTREDRPALNVVLVATAATEALKYGFTIHTISPEKLFVPAGLELLTIAALLLASPGKPAIRQSVCLAIAILAHVVCYLDIKLATNFVYDGYESILGLVAAAQVACFLDTITHNLLRVVTWLDSILPTPAQMGASLVHLS